MSDQPTPEKQALDAERKEVLQQVESWLETPLLVLAFVWLALLLVELIWELSPLLEMLVTVIWIVFVLDLVVKLSLAPDRSDYLKRNWLNAIALMVPALRVFRIVRLVRLARAARAARGLRLVRVITSLNRGMKALGAAMVRRGFTYVIALSLVVLLSGAAGMYAFEKEIPGGLHSYGEALWWTSMLLTSIGSEYWPQTPEGRALCFLLALYGFGIFGYVTATLASFFIDRDAADKDAEIAGAKSVETLRAEITALRAEIGAIASRLEKNP